MRGKPALPTIFRITPAAHGGRTRRKVCWFNRGTVGRPPWNWPNAINEKPHDPPLPAAVRERGEQIAMPSTLGNPVMDQPLPPELLSKMNAYWRAANYLSVGQIYLYDKPRLLGHWGTTPGLNFIYVHLNRIINQYDLNAIYVTGPGHGGPGLVAY